MIILASQSPRRRELLKYITNDFEVKTANVDETLENGISPDKAVEYLSKIKAEPFKNGFFFSVYVSFTTAQSKPMFIMFAK